MVDKQHEGIIVTYIAQSTDTEEFLQFVVDNYLEADIFAKMLYVDSGDCYGYMVAAPRHILEKHLKSCGWNSDEIAILIESGSFNSVEVE